MRNGAFRLLARAGKGYIRNPARNMSERSSRMSGFHNMGVPDRLDKLVKSGFLSEDGKAALSGQGLQLEDANHMIENVIGTFKMPLGVSLNMVINGKE
jgi:hydroxymethylglutaryl-CoA reductase